MVRFFAPHRAATRGRIASLALAATACLVHMASAADPAADAVRKAVEARGAAYIDAIAKNDVASALEFWTPQAIIVDAFGNSHQARDFVKERFAERAAALKSQPGAPVPPEIELPARGQIRVVTPDVAIEEGGLAERDRVPGQLQYTVVWVRRDNAWYIDSAREVLVPNPAEYGSLHDLAWMVGTWRGQKGDAQVTLTVKFIGEGALLRRDYAISIGGKETHTGTQIVAWDPRTHQIRSWLFDSQGAVSEGEWRHDGVTWVVTSRGFLPDGQETRSIDEYELTEKGLSRYTTDAWVGNQQMPVSEMILEPVPAAK